MRSFSLLDERGTSTFRSRAGALLTAASRADFAVMRVRLAALDLTPEEVARVRRCRVLLGRFDAATVVETAEAAAPGTATRLGVLRSFVVSGRLEVRSAGLGWWSPDFSVFRRPEGSVALFGAHYFGAPYSAVGPSFTAEVRGRAVTRPLSERFESLWEAGYDVLPVVREVVEGAHALALEAGRGRGGPDRPLPPR